MHHIALAGHMRAAKAKIQKDLDRQMHHETMLELADTLKQSALRVGSKLVVGTRRGSPTNLALVALGGKQKLTGHAWITLAVDDGLIGDRPIARRFSISPATVREALFLMSYMIVHMTQS